MKSDDEQLNEIERLREELAETRHELLVLKDDFARQRYVLEKCTPAERKVLDGIGAITRWAPCEVDADDEDGPVFQGFLTDPSGGWVKYEDIAELARRGEKP